MEFNWRRVAAKDYSTMDTAIITTLALFGLQAVRHQGFDGAQGDLITFGAILLLVQLVALAILVMKRPAN